MIRLSLISLTSVALVPRENDEVMSVAAQTRGLGIRGTGKDFGARGWINFPMLLGGLNVSPGDLIVGDADGTVVIPRERAAALVQAAAEREAKELEVMEQLRNGARTLEVYGF